MIPEEQDLLRSVDQPQAQVGCLQKIKRNELCHRIALLVFLLVVGVTAVVLLFSLQSSSGPALKIACYSPLQMELGEGRVLELLFFTGFDNRTKELRQQKKRTVKWTTSPAGIVSVDEYGRAKALQVGKAKITVQSMINTALVDQIIVEVVPVQKVTLGTARRVVNFKGQPARENRVLTRVKTDQVRIPLNPSKTVVQGNVTWQVLDYANGSREHQYVLRTDPNSQPRDRVMYFVGERYLPGDGLRVEWIEDDGASGIFVGDPNGQTARIRMVNMSYREKAELLLSETQQKVMRHGLASDSYFDGQKQVRAISDNDGLWTSMFTVGELMKYSHLRDSTKDQAQIKKARDSALYSLKAALLLLFVPCRNGQLPARIRHFNNTRVGKGQFLSQTFLKEGAELATDNYVGSPADGSGFYGMDAGRTVDGDYYGGQYKYSLGPLQPDSWVTNPAQAAKSNRSLSGFIARTFLIQGLDGPPPGGLFFKHNPNGTQTVLSEANVLYDFTKDQNPVLNIGDTQLPPLLKDFLAINGTQYNKSDLIYKGDTSSDEIIGHLFLYKVAFDVLSNADDQQHQLKLLISEGLSNFCKGLAANGYTMVDATGQGTTWAKLTRDFLNSDFTLEDAPIKALELLMSFKVCEYVTGNPRWGREYRYLVEDHSHRYLDLTAKLWDRWVFRAYNEDDSRELITRLNESVKYSEQQLIRHIMYRIHYSDEEEALLGFYLAFQLEEDEQLLSLYRKALAGWWHSCSRSENPLWYYIYQLSQNQSHQLDYFNNSLVDTASWQLSRHPSSARKSRAYIEGARPDVLLENRKFAITTNPQKVVGKRNHKPDEKQAQRQSNKQIFSDYNVSLIYEMRVLPSDERSIHKFNGATFVNPMEGNSESTEACTVYSLPLWMGVYHNMLLLSQK